MLLSCVYFFWVSGQNVFGMIVTETEHFFFFFLMTCTALVGNGIPMVLKMDWTSQSDWFNWESDTNLVW